MKGLYKGIISAALIGTMLMSAAGCTKFEVIGYKDFRAALEDEAGIDESSCSTGKDRRHDGYEMKRYIEGEKGNCEFAFYEFDKEKDAVEYFEKQYDEFLDAVEDDDEFEGSHKESFDEDSATGYIIFDGEVEENGRVYGGIYLKENTIVSAMSVGSKDKDIERIDGVLDAIGYPKP